MEKEKSKKVETEEEFLDLKERINKEEKLKRILNISLWALLFIWMAFCITDFILAKTDNKPVFCTFSKTTKYDDGNVKSCIGLGYKVYAYDRDSYSGIEFAPLWGKDKSIDKK